MSINLFSAQDKAQLKRQGITSAQAQDQLRRFKKGFPYTTLVHSCTVGSGIVKLRAEEQKKSEQAFLRVASGKKIIKFVPASGAASRMFHFLEDVKPESAALKQKFLKHLPEFAFYSALSKVLKKKGQDIVKLRKAKKLAPLVQALLEKEGLGYRQAPKGMILFHRDGKQAHTAFEDQLREGVVFKGAKKKIQIHFTLSEIARTEVRKHLKAVIATMPQHQFILSDSIQSRATDCLAVEKKGALVRDKEGQLFFRPAGHGALLKNLNQIKADLIYVKNIDNILSLKNRTEADRWKRILSGFFLQIQGRVFEAQKILNQNKMTPQEALFISLLACELGVEGLDSRSSRGRLRRFFNRPLRVCGMVPNTGEPGGGPFWTRDAEGNVSAQIIESAEVNFRSKTQESIWRTSTHFNPVDFVCGVYDYKGNKYNLLKYSDAERGLITQKSYQGREIQVMELPGLWNGGMANWISVFVEIPGAVFAPVKTVLDLLRKEHQS